MSKTTTDKCYIWVALLLILGLVGAGKWAEYACKEPFPGNNSALHTLQDSLQHRDSVRLSAIEWQQDQIAYYIKSHSVLDNGFDIVAHYAHLLLLEKDSINKADSALAVLYSKEMLQYLIAKAKAECTFPPVDNAPDTIPYYMGDTDPFGKRSGIGVDLTPGQRMRVGEWRNDSYLGERITYSSERVYGIDISRYQHEKGKRRFTINWSNLTITSLGTKSKKSIQGPVSYPISFIYIKSTEGTTVRNRYFATDYLTAKKHGYRTGAYHFFSTKTAGRAQARYFCGNTHYTHGDLPPVIDIEPTDQQIRKMGGTQAMMTQIRAWLHYVEAYWGVKPVLYVGQKFVNKYLPSAPDLMRNYDVWIARYGEYKPEVNLVIWQLCQDGRVQGIQTPVDINVFSGFKEDFDTWRK